MIRFSSVLYSALLGLSGFALFSSTVQASFSDVDITHPYYHAINDLQERGIIEGNVINGVRQFRPLGKINRAEALKILMIASQTPVLENDPEVFPDVPFSAWFSPYVNTAANKQIVKGFTNGKFHPESQVSRAEFLKMLIKSFDISHREPQGDQAWFDPFFEVTEELRILPGTQRSANASLTRGEVAEMIFRTFFVQERNFESRYIFSGSGQASYYNEGFAGKLTANGEIYDPFAMTAAHRTLPFDTRIKVTNEDGKSIFVRINDRGPYHKERVLDLSQRAFESLAPISRGVVEVSFEVYSDTVEEPLTIPEQIRPQLSDEAKEEKVPDSIVENLSGSIEIEEDKEPQGLAPQISVRPLFSEPVTSLTPNFFGNATLRRSIPQKVVEGTVVKLAGSADQSGYSSATFFIQNKDTGKQNHFKGPISGRNFSIPVSFLEVGTYQLGLVFDAGTKSRVADIEVVQYPTAIRKFPSSDFEVAGSRFEVSVIPEEEHIRFVFDSEDDRVTRLTFAQGAIDRDIYIEDGMEQVDIAYDFFKTFRPGEDLAIDVYQAGSKDGTLYNQKTNWRKGPFENFELTYGFPDAESEKISVENFPRFVHRIAPVTIKGTINDIDVRFPDHIFVIRPDGEVDEFPLVRQGSQFSARMTPREWGSYVFEIVSDQGEVLFNRAIYIDQDQMLPVFPWKQTAVRSNSRSSALKWINDVRRAHTRTSVIGNVNLDNFAQDYADYMAANDFIGHTDLEGRDFSTRVRAANLDNAEYGENLSYGTEFPLALEGLENSASHRKNILSSRWNKVGIGIAQNAKGHYYIAQVFGR